MSELTLKPHGHDCACGCQGHEHHHEHHHHEHGANCSCGCGGEHHDHDHEDCEQHKRHFPQSFEAAFEVASEAEGSYVVHGYIRMPDQDKWILHAWTEVDEAVYDLLETRDPQGRADWYVSHGVTEERLRRYGRVNFFTRFAETGSMGPFDEEFFAITESDVDPLLPRA
ncbi:MAG: hypothetical protein R3Y11_06735 [Pseudomonadota bacterium]